MQESSRLVMIAGASPLWGCQTVSSVSTGIVKLAAPLLVLALTESRTTAGLVGGALTLRD